MLPLSHPVKQQVVEAARSMMEQFRVLRDVGTVHASVEETCISKVKLDQVALSKGCARYSVEMEESCYYQMLSEMTGMELKDEYDLMEQLRDLSQMQKKYGTVMKAMDMVRQKGYGMVLPEKEEIHMEDPVLIHQSGKFGVKDRTDRRQ